MKNPPKLIRVAGKVYRLAQDDQEKLYQELDKARDALFGLQGALYEAKNSFATEEQAARILEIDEHLKVARKLLVDLKNDVIAYMP